MANIWLSVKYWVEWSRLDYFVRTNGVRELIDIWEYLAANPTDPISVILFHLQRFSYFLFVMRGCGNAIYGGCWAVLIQQIIANPIHARSQFRFLFIQNEMQMNQVISILNIIIRINFIFYRKYHYRMK